MCGCDKHIQEVCATRYSVVLLCTDLAFVVIITASLRRFAWGLGMPLVAKSDQSTGNGAFASYVLKSNNLTFIFTAPYSRKLTLTEDDLAVPSYNHDLMYNFVNSHGLAVRAVGRLPLLHKVNCLVFSHICT